MIGLILLIFASYSFSQEPIHWNYLLSVEDKHEFYENDKPVDKPKNSWQVLFSLSFLDSNFAHKKDCILYKVAGEDPGILKVKTVNSTEGCDKHLFAPGDFEIQDIKSLQFHLAENSLAISYSQTNYKNGKLVANFQSSFRRPDAKTGLSSAEFKSAKIIMLAPVKSINEKPTKISLVADKEICHKIEDDCSESSPSICSQCANGWYEIPNGCPTGPKICGYKDCGKKDGHACRRGYMWQRADIEFDCRLNSNFAYCEKGLKVVCEGRSAFCR